MNLDVSQVAELLVSHAVRSHGDAVSLIACYGSRATGQATAYSDLDIFYTPAEGADPLLARQFIVEGVPVDFWPIRWSTLEGFATGRLRGWAVAPGLVLSARLLYARSDEETARFEAVRRQVTDLQNPAARKEMVRRALAAFPAVLAHIGNLRLACADGDPASIRWAGWQVILSAVECLALVNQTTFPRGWGHLLEQLPLLRFRPEGSDLLITALATSPDPVAMTAAAEELAAGTRRILRRAQDAFPPEAGTADVFGSAYPEIREHINKVLAACEKGNPVAASHEASFIQNDIAQMLAGTRAGIPCTPANLYGDYAGPYRELGFPNLMQATATHHLAQLAGQTDLLDARLREWLRDRGIDLHVYPTFADLRDALAG